MSHSGAYLRTLRRAAILQAIGAIVKTRRRCDHKGAMILMFNAVICGRCGEHWLLTQRER